MEYLVRETKVSLIFVKTSNWDLSGSLPPKAALALPLGELAKIFDF